jgi:hypothetical protein
VRGGLYARLASLQFTSSEDQREPAAAE